MQHCMDPLGNLGLLLDIQELTLQSRTWPCDTELSPEWVEWLTVRALEMLW